MKVNNQLSTAGILMALAIVLGAFGAHMLEGKLSPYHVDIWGKAVLYHALNTLGLFAISLSALHFKISLKTPYYLVLAGIIIFSGSLYSLALTDIRVLGAITPIGGVSFIAGWITYSWQLSKATS